MSNLSIDRELQCCCQIDSFSGKQTRQCGFHGSQIAEAAREARLQALHDVGKYHYESIMDNGYWDEEDQFHRESLKAISELK